MAHPYKDKAFQTKRDKSSNLGKKNNLDIPVMAAVGENRAGGVRESRSSMQHMSQAAKSGYGEGYARGGRTGHAAQPATSEHQKVYGATKTPIRKMVGEPKTMPYPLGNKGVYGGGSRSGAGRLAKNHVGPPPFKPIGGGNMNPIRNGSPAMKRGGKA